MRSSSTTWPASPWPRSPPRNAAPRAPSRRASPAAAPRSSRCWTALRTENPPMPDTTPSTSTRPSPASSRTSPPSPPPAGAARGRHPRPSTPAYDGRRGRRGGRRSRSVAWRSPGARHDSSVEPASSLPTPAALDAAALSTATQGWTLGVEPRRSSQRPLYSTRIVRRCLDKAPVKTVQPEAVRASGDMSFTAGEAAALAVLGDCRGRQRTAKAVWNGLARRRRRCSNVTLSGQQEWEGGEAISYAFCSPGGKTEHLWIARTGLDLRNAVARERSRAGALG